METRKLFVLSVSVWSADDYLNNRNTNPQHADHYVFATKEEAEERAQNITADADVYNDGVIYSMDLSDEQILDITGMESIEDFDEALRTPYSDSIWDSIWTKNYGEDEKDMVAAYIIEQPVDFEEVECANYNFDQTLDGAILVFWSWERHIGYARKLIDVRFAYHDETEAILAKQDRTYVTQCDVLLTADEVKNAGEYLREAVRKELEDKHDWRWRNPSFIDTLIEQF